MSNFGHGGDWWERLPLGRDKPLPKKSGPPIWMMILLLIIVVIAVWLML